MNQFSPLSRGLDAIAARVAEVLGPHDALAGDRLRGTDHRGRAGERSSQVVTQLRDDPELRFISFIDLCGVD